jgi:hypothetical protein
VAEQSHVLQHQRRHLILPDPHSGRPLRAHGAKRAGSLLSRQWTLANTRVQHRTVSRDRRPLCAQPLPFRQPYTDPISRHSFT